MQTVRHDLARHFWFYHRDIRSFVLLVVRRFGTTCLSCLKGSSSLAAHKNYIKEEINSRLQSDNACCYCLQNVLSYSLIYINIKIKIYRIIFLSVVLYGCETWSYTLREERRLRVFENRVLRGVFGPKRDEVTGEWRKLHKENLNDLYCLMICTA